MLLVYGGGSIKRTGLYQTIQDIFNKNGVESFELAGVEPNPKIETVRKGAAFCRQHQIQVILAVGGGSTIDCSKVVAAGAKYDGDPWDMVLNGSLIKDTLPLITILTIAVTGSLLKCLRFYIVLL